MRLLICLFALTSGLYSCQEYTAYYPAGQPDVRTLKSPYTGNWQYISAINQDSTKSIGYGPHTLRITPFSEDEFLLQLISDSLKSIRDIDHFRGFISEIDGHLIANISPIDELDNRPVYSVYKFELNEDTLKFWGMGENRFKSYNLLINSMKDHKRFVEENINKPETWNMAYLYLRKK